MIRLKLAFKDGSAMKMLRFLLIFLPMIFRKKKTSTERCL